MASKQTNLSSFFNRGSKKRKTITGDVESSATNNNDGDTNINDPCTSFPKAKVVKIAPGPVLHCLQTPSRARQFQTQWLEEFTWLRFEGGDRGLMFCKFCEVAGKQNGFTKGSSNFQKSAVKEHKNSASHREALLIRSEKSNMQTYINQAQEQKTDNLTAMMQTVLFMAKENISSHKFNGLINLQKRNGCPALTGAIYTHSDSFQDMETALVETTVGELKQKIAGSKFVGLIIDETVNVVVEKKLIMFLRIINDAAKIETIFLGNYSVHNGTAECIVDKIKEVFKEWNIPLKKVAGLGSDGASVMTGMRNGVGVKLQKDSPFLIHVHCIAHRVALASQDAANLSKKIADYRKTLNEVYKLYEYSATRYNRLRDLSKELSDTEFSTVKQPSTVRWLSLGRAVKSTKLNWPALVMEIEEEAAERKNPVAVGLQKILKSYSFIATTYMLSDVLPCMEKLVTVFQRETLNLSMIRPMVNSTIETLETLLNTKGANESEFKRILDESAESTQGFRGIVLSYADQRSQTAFETVRSNFISDLVMSLKTRFPDDSLNVLSSLDIILNPSRYPSDSNDLDVFGCDSLNVLLDYFCSQSDNNIEIDRTRATGDFIQFKRMVSGLGTKSLEDTCRTVISDFADLFPDYETLAVIALVVPVSSVPAERGFSLQNLIHTSLRNRLTQRRMNNLMTLNMHAQYSEDRPFNFGKARQIFKSAKDRRI